MSRDDKGTPPMRGKALVLWNNSHNPHMPYGYAKRAGNET
ncbi:hypothetical protein CCC_02749 [Paramagnetospirillum magnetotacticum MS-1]|uniref:Uncharacterized protein n=1 Tax=Paramagnetospirillum magnetotacticum MS-1 TaxID=272627 RepID=A0A0C2YZ74_PARME|nr:hypothetical protein CCC_02749 [Paramagnetospirillum magnetotacticum MS-1]